MALGLITNIFIVRKLSIEEYGVFSVILLVIGFITTFGFSWSSSSILYFGSREKVEYGNINKTFWARNIIIFISLIITTLGFVVFRKEISDYIGFDETLLLLLWLYVSVAEDFLSQYFLAVKKQIMSSMLSITAKLIYIGLVLLFTFDVKTLIILNIISNASVIFYFFGMKRDDIGKFEFDKLWFKKVLNFSVWQLFGFSGIYLINFGDIAVIKHYMTLEDVGIYSAAYKLFGAVASFAFVISSYYASNISFFFTNNDTNKIKDFYYKERLIIITICSIGHLLVILFSKPLILILFGEQYLESVKVFNILMIGSVFRYITIFYMLYYNSTGKHSLQQIINILVAVSNILLDIFLINIFGLVGPAIATTITMILGFVFSFFYCERRIKKFSLGRG
jgi:O-antigen/teichoic acid export membrane protein